MTNALRMTVGADPGAVTKAGAAFAQFAEAHALPAPVRRSVQVALDELLTNTVTYGGGGEVTVEVELRHDRVSVTLSDDGRPFDPFGPAVPRPDTALSLDERRLGGLGVHLVRGVMDEVSYQRRGDRNIVVLAKLLSGGRSMDVTVVAFAGKLDSNTSPAAQQKLDGILAGGARKIVIDFTGLDYISSAGLRVLLGAAKRLRSGGGELRLFGLNETVREVFQISGFATILAVFGTEAEARAGL